MPPLSATSRSPRTLEFTMNIPKTSSYPLSFFNLCARQTRQQITFRTAIHRARKTKPWLQDNCSKTASRRNTFYRLHVLYEQSPRPSKWLHQISAALITADCASLLFHFIDLAHRFRINLVEIENCFARPKFRVLLRATCKNRPSNARSFRFQLEYP